MEIGLDRNDAIAGFFGHEDSVFAVAAHPTRRHLIASGGGDNRLHVWNLLSGDHLPEAAAATHGDSVVAVAFSHDGVFLAAGGMDGKISVVDCGTLECVVTLEGPEEVVWINWHPRGHVLLCGSVDGTMWMWQVPSGKCLNVFSGHNNASVTCGGFTPDGRSVVSAGEDGRLLLWDPKSGEVRSRLGGGGGAGGGEDARFHSSGITAMAVNRDSQVVLTGGDQGSSRISHLASQKILGTLPDCGGSIESVSFSPIFPNACVSSVDGTILVWDMKSMQTSHTMMHSDAVTRIVSSDSFLLTSSSSDSTVRIWDTRTGSCERTFYGHSAPVLDIALVGDDGCGVVTASDDGMCLYFAA